MLIRQPPQTSVLLHRLQEAPPNAWHATEHEGGVRLSLPLWPTTTVHIYALPWARGWSVFASNDADCKVHAWRNVPSAYRGLRVALHNKNRVVGPEHADADSLLVEMLRIVDHFVALNKAKRIRRWPQAMNTEYFRKLWPEA